MNTEPDIRIDPRTGKKIYLYSLDQLEAVRNKQPLTDREKYRQFNHSELHCFMGSKVRHGNRPQE